MAADEDRGAPATGDGLKGRAKRALAWWKQTRIARGLARYGAANGALLTGGIAYSALFSIFAALVVGVSIFMALLGSDEELRTAVFDALSSALPGIVDTGDGGLISPENLEFSPGASVITAIIGFLVLINTATSVMAALRRGIRAMFGIVMPGENAVVAKLRDLGGFVALAAAVVLTAALGIAVGAAGSVVIDAVGLGDAPGTEVVLRILGHLVALGVDMLVVLVLIRGLGGARPPRRDLLLGSLLVAIGAGVIRFLGTSLVGSVAGNTLLAPFAAIVTLLLWVNLVVRVLLMVCAWTANPPAAPEVRPDEVTHADETPNFVTLSQPDSLAWDHDPLTGRIRPEPAPEPEPYWGGLIGWARRKWRGFREA